MIFKSQACLDFLNSLGDYNILKTGFDLLTVYYHDRGQSKQYIVKILRQPKHLKNNVEKQRNLLERESKKETFIPRGLEVFFLDDAFIATRRPYFKQTLRTFLDKLKNQSQDSSKERVLVVEGLTKILTAMKRLSIYNLNLKTSNIAVEENLHLIVLDWESFLANDKISHELRSPAYKGNYSELKEAQAEDNFCLGLMLWEIMEVNTKILENLYVRKNKSEHQKCIEGLREKALLFDDYRILALNLTDFEPKTRANIDEVLSRKVLRVSFSNNFGFN